MAHLLPRLMRVGMAICLIAILAGHGSAGAEERLALVISNQDYPVEVGRLGKTHEDGRLVAEALKSVGFKVEVVRDADKAVMQLAVAEYISRLARAGPSAVGFFYYSGHGAASSKDGPNFLIPTSAPLTDGAQLPFLAIELGDIVAALSKTSAKANFVVVDACRNVPFTRSDKSAHKGFRPENGRSGVMIAYATDPGNVAVDENVYARALAREIPVANRPAVLMFRAVRRAVLNATGNKQHPWTRDGLVNDFFFKRAAVSPAPPVTDTEPAPKPQLEFDTRALDLAFWNQIENSQNPEDFEDYLKHFPNGTFKRFALRRLEELQKVVADVLPPDAPKPPVRLRPAPPGTVHFIPQHAYRTGPFGGMGTPLADGFHDYLAMLNERDGGIGGVPLKPEECETGYNAQRGVDCYLETKSRNPLVYNPLSTGISLQLIPRAEKDKVPVLTSGYGLSAVADGELFPWIFNFPSVYWHRMTSIISYIRSQGGIRGRKIAFLYLNVGYGREPIALLEEIAREVGFELLKIPVGVKEMQDQSSQWLEIRKERPDWVIMWSWGVMTTVAIKQAANTRFPMDRFIGNVWAAENAQVAAAGPGAKGVKTANFHGTGSNYPALKDMVRLVLNRGKSRAGAATVGTAFYNRGVFNAVIVAEAIRTAQNLTGRAAITGRDMRKGLEQLNLSAERLKELGLEGFMEPIRGSCRDHSGSGSIFIQQWNGSSWERVSENIAPDVYRVRPKLKAAARAYVSDRTGWPTQVCP